MEHHCDIAPIKALYLALMGAISRNVKGYRIIITDKSLCALLLSNTIIILTLYWQASRRKSGLIIAEVERGWNQS